jgi:hypothetical protein
MSLAADAPHPRPPGPSLALSIIVIVIASAIGITGFAIGITSVVHRVTHLDDSPNGILPDARITASLTPATWQVYVEEDASGLVIADVDSSAVTVTDPQGNAVAVRDMPSNLSESVDSGGDSYQAAVRFDVSQSGTYDIEVQTDSTNPGAQIIIAKSLGSTVSGLAKWFAMAGLGFLLGVAGIAMLIVGIVRRKSYRRRLAYPGGFTGPGPGTGFGGGFYPAATTPLATEPQSPAPPTAGPPAGWYDDPHLPGMQRYWDGGRWTDQTRNLS